MDSSKLRLAVVLVALSVHFSAADFTQYRDFILSQANNATLNKLFAEHVKKFRVSENDLKLPTFPCSTYSVKRGPVTVHNLTPQDIKVVAGVGDSITAGTGIQAQTVIGLLTEYRGLSWSIGGDKQVEDYVTLANILKKYNPDIKGFSVGRGDVDSANAHLNVANPGDQARDMPGQAKLLVERLKEEPGVDFENDWKVITLFIGGNDLCDYCDDKETFSTANFIGHVTEALDILHQNIPRAFVNVVETLNIADINVLNEGLICDTIHFFLCRCGTFPTEKERDEMRAAVKSYQKAIADLASSGRYDTRDDFTVVAQPFYEETDIPRLPDSNEADLSYFAPDCFHLSEKGHKCAAEALWNNMIEPVGQKRLKWTPKEEIECPSADNPFFYTGKNSLMLSEHSDSKRDPTTAPDSADSGKTRSASSLGGIGIGVACLVLVGMICVLIFVGNQQAGGGGGGQGDKKDDKERKKKYEPPVPTRVGKKKKKSKGPDTASKLPQVTPHTRCRLKLLKLERIKDYLLMEEEFIRNQERLKPQEEKHEEERTKVDELRGSPMSVGTLEEIIDDNHAIVSTSVGSEHYVSILSFVDKDQLEPGCSVLLNHKVHAVVGVLGDDTDPMVTVMKLEKAPQETYADIGGLDQQIQEIKESVELPLTHPEYYEEMGIKPPKGVILYGPPGTGKTLLAKAVANQTSATFLRVVGSELIQKYLGDGPKLVRELFRVAEEHAPSIVFIDEIDAVGTKRYDSNSGGEREIQRTMLELLNQLDGFDSRGDVKVVMATNRIETLDPALIRPGRIDRKIEFPLPDEKTKRRIFTIHTNRMTLAEDVNIDDYVMAKDDLSGADIKAICTEAGLLALRERRMKVTNDDFKSAKENVLYRKNEGTPEGLYL
ncbi:uncharacterized protein LOC125652446 [Ostrea edulis]|uniref:uncharacterized protein LOC125652446 n=1 Tax=Ostrea edulis TaxID=37623 RepID=UPI0024AF0CCA|nr:uncharacterized protein LOC125652446 [Ostrea edulis]